MCGINGFIRTKACVGPVSNAERTVRDLIYYSRPRGVDALGMFKYKESKDQYEWVKGVGDPGNVQNRENFKDFLKENVGFSKFFLMHNRHATKGSKESVDLAHPYEEPNKGREGETILVHNGTLNHIANAKDFPGKTDSQSLARMLAAGVPLEEIEVNIWGSWALVWFDSYERSLHFWRNKERPFGFAHSKEGVWFGSECYLVGGAMERNNIKLDFFEKLPPDQEWIWHVDSHEFEKRVLKYRPGKASINYNNWTEEDYEYLPFVDKRSFPKSSGGSGEKPKESSSGEAGSDTGGRTKVQPFQSPLAPTSSIQTLLPSFKHSHKPDPKRRPRKPKFSQVAEMDGWKRGDQITFSLSNWFATNRPNQVKLEGIPVLFLSDQRTALAQGVEIFGMVGGEGWTIDKIDESTCLYQGLCKEFRRAIIDGKPFFKVSVGNIEPVKCEDPFREEKIKEPTKVPLEPTGLKKAISQATKSILTKGKKDSTISGNSSDPLAGIWLKCDRCGTFYSKKTLNRMVHGNSENNEYGPVLMLCNGCLQSLVADDAALNTLFDIARKEELARVLDQNPQPTNATYH